MAPDLSDSSDEEVSYTTTSVMLGYASKEPTSDDFSQLGGFPTWPNPTDLPSAALAKCRTCNKLMSLLLQLNGDLPERFEGHERRLYVFACKNKPCRKKNGTVRAVRGTKVDKTSFARDTTSESNGKRESNDRDTKHPIGNLGNNIFAPNAFAASQLHNPFSATSTATSNGSSITGANPFAAKPTGRVILPNVPAINKPTSQAPTIPFDLTTTFVAKARISTSPQPLRQSKDSWSTTDSSLSTPWPSYHLDADSEALEPPSSSSSANGIPDTHPHDNGITSDEKDAFESQIDKTFQRFADRLAQNPEQVLRYEFGGSPLLYSKSDVVGKALDAASTLSHSPPSSGSKINTVSRQDGGSGVPPCTNCGKARVFEMQLVPQAIAELEVDEMGIDGMEWGTIIVSTCSADCTERGVELGLWGWVEEWVGVQWEDERGTGGKA